MSKLLPYLVKKIAEGDFGSFPAKVYWFLAGKKMYLAVIIGIGGVSLDYLFGQGLCEQCADYKGFLLEAAAVLAAIGLYDGAIRSTPPEEKDA